MEERTATRLKLAAARRGHTLLPSAADESDHDAHGDHSSDSPVCLARAGSSRPHQIDAWGGERGVRLGRARMAADERRGSGPSSIAMGGRDRALGHPVGASGGRLFANLLAALEERAAAVMGVQTMCESGGMANATLIERL